MLFAVYHICWLEMSKYSFSFVAVSSLHKNPTLMLIALESILTLPKEELLAFSDDIVSSLPQILAVNVPRKIIDLVKKVWFKLHSLTPRR